MPGACSFQHTGSGLLLPPQNSHALHLHSAQWVLCFLSSLHQVAHRASVLSSAVCGTHGADAIVVGGRGARLRGSSRKTCYGVRFVPSAVCHLP